MKTNKSNNRLGDFQVDIENLFDHFFGDQIKTASPVNGMQPRADIVESDSQFTLVMELPGVSADDVSIEMKEGRLDVAGTKSINDVNEGERRIKNERRAGEFHRAFEFPSQLDADKISAEFKHGLLTIVLPKSEKVLPRKIEIKTTES
jgi:HSP20 family protein